jgi:dTDP-4-amino-4,6-dideoxygalactose transaminase
MRDETSFSTSARRRDLHVGRPNIGDRSIFDQLVDEIFERRWFTNRGLVVRDFEQKLQQHLEVKHCIAVSNATVGLQVACHALGLSGEVILPSFTFVATANAVSLSNLRLVFADVDLATHCLDPSGIEALITDKTTAILGVHLWGNPCCPDALQSIAQDHGLALIFDAAHAFHNTNEAVPIGNFGDCEVFSFHATKFFNTFEGGAITTNDDQLADNLRKRINFGFDGPDSISCIGTNGKMSEFNAAMGISMVPKIENLRDQNQLCHKAYRDRFRNARGLNFHTFNDRHRSNFQYAVLEVDEHEFGASRNDVVEFLNQHRVFAKRYFYPGCHRLPPYRHDFVLECRKLPNTEILCSKTMCLPMGGNITTNEISQVCDLVLRSRVNSVTENSMSRSRKAAS